MSGSRWLTPGAFRREPAIARSRGAGYVRRVPDPRDARARLVQIAERGRAAVEVARQTEAKVEAEWTAHLGEKATAHLRHALAGLREITDPYQ
jgi:DNA-binding MarR family transcriptional regulator